MKANKTTIETANKVVSLQHRTEDLSNYIKRFGKRWDILTLGNSRFFDWRHMLDRLEDSDIEEINRYIINKTKKRIRVNKKELQELVE